MSEVPLHHYLALEVISAKISSTAASVTSRVTSRGPPGYASTATCDQAQMVNSMVKIQRYLAHKKHSPP